MALWIPIILGGMFAWNLLTDWVWIGNSLNLLPADAKQDIQKRALEIINLLKAGKDVVYSAQKQRRSLNTIELALLRKNAELAEEKIKTMQKIYSDKFILYGGEEVRKQMDEAINNLLLQIEDFKQMAGIAPRPAVTKIQIEDIVEVVFDGDTIKLKNGETVRLVGIDAPESTTDAGEVSKKYLKERLEGKKVIVASDPNALKDMYDRRLGVIFLNNENINIEMIKKGLANTSFFEPNALVFEKQWKAAADEVKKKKKTAAPGKIATPYVFKGVTPEVRLAEIKDEDTSVTVQKVKNFLETLPARLDFELASKINPFDANGKVVEGRYQIAHIYLFSGPYKKNKIADLIIRKMGETEKPLSKNEEDPIEETMRNFIKNVPITTMPMVPTTVTPIKVAEIIKNYYRYIGEIDVFEKNTNRKITFEEASQKNIWDQVEDIPRPATSPGPDGIIPKTAYESKNVLLLAAAGLPDAANRIQQIGPATTMSIAEVEPTINALKAIKKFQTNQLSIDDFATIPQTGFNTNIISPGGPYWDTLLNIQVVARRYNLSAKKLPKGEADLILKTQGLDVFNQTQQKYELQ